jgi:putative addiction module component (TIGR02574 family)
VNVNSDELFDAAMRLSESERALLVERLLETLSPDPEASDDQAFAAELERRRREVESGVEDTIPWSELKGQD